MRPGHISLATLSIKHRLPLLIWTLLLDTILAATWASYRAVRQAALEASLERLLNLSQHLASHTQQSTSTLLARTITAAGDPSIRASLRSPTADNQAAASAVLKQFVATETGVMGARE
jgi:hypothetical protein